MALAVCSVGRLALAQGDDFFRVSPGPLAAAHAKWDNSDGCTKCHKLGGGVTNLLCVSCHNHEDLRRAIQAQRGLHATFKRPCIDCHSEHDGRAGNITDWGPVGGRRAFKHDRTGFKLTAVHRRVACTACHKRRLSSGRTSYVELKAGCDDCHENPHGFTKPALRKSCEQCHAPGIRRKLRASQLPFNHTKVTGIALAGKHRRIECVACHKRGNMQSRKSPRTCAECHKNPHGVRHKGKTCSDCHAPERRWTKTDFKHDPEIFPTRGKHETAACDRCHVSPKKKPPRECAACHRDPHRKRFGLLACEACHGIGGTRVMELDHDRQTRFKLTGRHARARCRACHRGKGPREFERHETTACMDCHQHTKAHGGVYTSADCSRCHTESGKRKVAFDHQKDARFKLTGFHLALADKQRCGKCHKRKRYRTHKLRCVDCHQDSHDKQLGDACDRCHVTTVKFKKIEFDHNRLAQFKREGKHLQVECKKCHPKRRYRTGKKACYDCHAKGDAHKGRLGKDCGTCHVPDKGAPKFDHTTMTSFARTDSHAQVACAFCHLTLPDGQAPPVLGWTKGLKPPEKKDLLFPVMGKTCAECHRDPHEGRYGTTCNSCHKPTTFKDVERAVHDSGPFRLQGAHNQVPCWRCHAEGVQLAGTGDQCQLCHWEDDIHGNALGPTCGECHLQVDWTPARFNHGQVGYVLRGTHRLATCDGCHGLGTYQGTPLECVACHLQDAAMATDPIHTSELSECQNCHAEVAFVPARRYHPTHALRGAHSILRCGACHGGASYAGTPTECFGCHQAAYYAPANSQDHVVLGYPTTCEDCHTETAWIPATPATRP